jgi:UPF0716 family protein affecting phage T7 exclusion
VITLVRLVRLLLILVLALVTISFVIDIGSSATGAAEKLVLLALIAGCFFVAAQVWKLATRTRRQLQRRVTRSLRPETRARDARGGSGPVHFPQTQLR